MSTVLKIIKQNIFIKSSLFLFLFFLLFVWLRGGLNTFTVDTDFGRDLSELSKLWMGQKIIWLGPTLSPGFHASPLYYYLFFPALLIGRGSAYSLLIANILLATTVLGVLGWKKKTMLAVIVIGLSPCLRGLVLHPGNGYTYVLWLLLSLISMWFEFPFFFTSLFLGVAISFHPAAIFAVPILIYEWLRRKHELENIVHIVAGLIIPWSPIILFEIITKGYLFRQWLAHPGIGMKVIPSLINIQAIAGIIGLPLFGLGILYIILFLLGKTRERFWLFFCGCGLIFFIIVSQVPSHYLLGLICLLFFTGIAILNDRKWGQVFITLVILFYVVGIFFSASPSKSARSIEKIQSVAEKAIHTKSINKTDKLAVVAALDLENKVPQADDYRFFIRIKGYKVLDVTQYKDANKLIMFIENPQFDWKSWSTWETDQIGSKRIIQEQEIQGIKVIIFEKN